MNTLPVLKSGDLVELIAPASRCTDRQLAELKELVSSWQLNCLVKEDIFAEDLFCANSDELRFQHLKNALLDSEAKALICVRGGYGAMRLVPRLASLQPPAKPKIFVGMSDITSLHLYLQQHWGWPTIHGGATPDKFSAESIAALKSILFAERESVDFYGLRPLNSLAQENRIIESSVTGGNLTLIQASIGTNWQLDGRGKIILLEEINERGYRVDRMLEHLRQANIFKSAAAVLFADFLGGEEPNGTSLIQPVLQRFADESTIPVVQMDGIGHGLTNFPIPFATRTELHLGKEIHLTCPR
ncbi:S66 peptidase family protein [Legionella rowbothamii]|uniref:S66 peptidase family protein n=1 Tax=Legionella rowbothamii TaxID=96229 RepID=UPI001054C6FA|nr:LD-carboxypeptidase [Legionella rowbothamii]